MVRLGSTFWIGPWRMGGNWAGMGWTLRGKWFCQDPFVGSGAIRANVHSGAFLGVRDAYGHLPKDPTNGSAKVMLQRMERGCVGSAPVVGSTAIQNVRRAGAASGRRSYVRPSQTIVKLTSLAETYSKNLKELYFDLVPDAHAITPYTRPGLACGPCVRQEFAVGRHRTAHEKGHDAKPG